MTATLGTLELEQAAKMAAGNWRSFNCFVWWRAKELDDAGNWAIIYNQHRDSGLLDQSNAAVIAKALEQFTQGDDPDVVFERHDHWAVGWIEGNSIKVFDNNAQITDAFRAYHELAEQMERYPVLDENEYAEREYEAALQNIDLAAWHMKRDFKLPEGYESDVFDWLSQNRENALENTDDQGGWPDEADLQAAFAALGYRRRK